MPYCIEMYIDILIMIAPCYWTGEGCIATEEPVHPLALLRIFNRAEEARSPRSDDVWNSLQLSDEQRASWGAQAAFRPAFLTLEGLRASSGGLPLTDCDAQLDSAPWRKDHVAWRQRLPYNFVSWHCEESKDEHTGIETERWAFCDGENWHLESALTGFLVANIDDLLQPPSGTAVPAKLIVDLRISLIEGDTIALEKWRSARSSLRDTPGVTKLAADFPRGIPAPLEGARPALPSRHSGVPPAAIIKKGGPGHSDGWRKVCSWCHADVKLGFNTCAACRQDMGQGERQLCYEIHFCLLNDEARDIINMLHRVNKLIKKRGLGKKPFDLEWTYSYNVIPDMDTFRTLKQQAEAFLADPKDVAVMRNVAPLLAPGARPVASYSTSGASAPAQAVEPPNDVIRIGKQAKSIWSALRRNLLNLAKNAEREGYESYTHKFDNNPELRDLMFAQNRSRLFIPFTVAELQELVDEANPNEPFRSSDWIEKHSSSDECAEQTKRDWAIWIQKLLDNRESSAGDRTARKEAVAAHLLGAPASSSAASSGSNPSGAAAPTQVELVVVKAESESGSEAVFFDPVGPVEREVENIEAKAEAQNNNRPANSMSALAPPDVPQDVPRVSAPKHTDVRSRDATPGSSGASAPAQTKAASERGGRAGHMPPHTVNTLVPPGLRCSYMANPRFS